MHNFNQDGGWRNTETIKSKKFDCWNCNNRVASGEGYQNYYRNSMKKIYICPHCHAPNIFDIDDKKIILCLPGNEINKLPPGVNNLYLEIRKCMQSNCPNAAIILMRKLIMHIAVEEGESEGKKFIEYIDFLNKNGIVPKKSKNKAELVRNFGNSANHEIEERSSIEAQECFKFIELLLKVNYEFADEVREDE